MARLPSCVSFCQHAAERQRSEPRRRWRWPSGRPIIIIRAAAAGRRQVRRTGFLGWVARERGSACPAVASPPPQGGWARRYSSRTPAQHARATRRAAGQGSAGKNTSWGARAAFGGVWRLGAAGGCKGWGEHVRAPECVPRALQRTFPWGSSGVAAPVLWSCTFAALSQRATGPRSGRGATLTAQRRVAHVECSGKWREQQVQEQEVWLERSRLWHDTLIPRPGRLASSGGATTSSCHWCCATWPRWLRTSRPCAWLLATLPSCAAELRGASSADKPLWQAVLASRAARPVRGRSTWTS